MDQGWGPLEIIIVLVLVLALLGRFFGTGFGKKEVPDVVTYKGKTETVIPSFNDCGKLLVTAPKSLQKITSTSDYIAVQGTVKNCDTIAVAPDTFSIIVVDAYGSPVTEAQTASVVVNQSNSSFADTVEFTTMPRTGTGYVIITRISNKGSQVPEEGARIPIRFVNQ